MSDDNLNIRVQCATCGAQENDPCREQDPDSGCPDGVRVPFVPLSDIPSWMIEELRTQNLEPANEAKGSAAPDVPPASDDQLASASLGTVGDSSVPYDQAKSPSDGLG